MHLSDSVSKLRPRRPTKFFQRKTRYIHAHRPDGIENRVPAALKSSTGHPEFGIDLQFFMKFQGCTGSGHEILLWTSCPKGADTKDTAALRRLVWLQRVVEIVHVRQIRTRRLIRLTDPLNELCAVATHVEIQST